jgi:hypothetical protein
MLLFFKLANKMLTSAIKEIQDQFYSEFKNNRQSERLFERMHAIISRNVFIYQRHNAKFAMDTVKDKSSSDENIDAQALILKFLKSMCENHHDQLQRYMIHQEYSRNQYSMVTVIISYLKVLVEVIKQTLEPTRKHETSPEELEREELRMKMSYKHAFLSIRALVEFVQGPCPENQREIATATFFEIANHIITLPFLFDDAGADKKHLMNNFQISQLKKECATLLLSLMEQQDITSSMMARMRQHITEEHLLFNLYYTYYAFTKESDGDYTEELLFEVRRSVSLLNRQWRNRRARRGRCTYWSWASRCCSSSRSGLWARHSSIVCIVYDA